jgi:hypothetical protein
MCAKCDAHPVGPGGILCPGCLTTLTEKLENFWQDHPQAKFKSKPGNPGEGTA